MPREADFATRMSADATLMAILTGGVHQSGTVGRLGITRDSVPGAWDANGYLRPTALVRERNLIPDTMVRDPIAQAVSAAQVVELYVYEDTNYSNIDAALARLHVLFEGHQFSDSFEVQWIGTINRERDEGTLAGSSMARIEFIVYSIV